MKEFDIRHIERMLSFNSIKEDLKDDFTLKHLGEYGVTARTLQFWNDNELLPIKNRKKDENHKFNFVEFIWIGIICELRLFRYPMSKIKEIKEKLFCEKSMIEFLGFKEGDDPYDFFLKYFPHFKNLNTKIEPEKILALFSFISFDKKIPLLRIYISLFIQERVNLKLIIFNNGRLEMLASNDSPDSINLLKEIEHKTYLTIPMSKLMSQFMKFNENNELAVKYHLLTETELKVLHLVKINNFDTLKIFFKQGEPFLLEATENIKVSKDARLSEILVEGGYEKLEIKTNDGVIAFSPKTTKYFL